MEIPAAYLTLRDDDRTEVAARARAAELIAKLAAPLPLPLQIFEKLGTVARYTALGLFALAFLLGFGLAISDGGGGGLLTLVFAVFVGLLAVPMAWEWLLRALADRLHVDLVDRLSGLGAHLLLGLVVAIFLLVPLALGVYARRMIALRARLQQMFASKPPARPGGPASCRHCDAPLDVPAGALGVRCLYCDTDNLVALSEGVVALATTSATKSHKAIEDADGERVAARFDAIGRVKVLVLLGVLAIPLWGALGMLTELVMDQGYAPGHLTRARGTPMLFGEGAPRPPGDVALDCTLGCTFYVPLQHGQTLHVRGPATAQRREIGHWYHLDWWQWIDLEPGPVKHTGWYRIVGGSSREGQRMTWSVQ